MASVDDRIVRMEFDNAAFERNLHTTLVSIGHLNEALKFQGAGKGLAEISAAGSKVDLSHIGSALDNISSKFHAMGAVAFTVISNLTTQALQFAKNIGHDILDPIISGGTSRAKNIEQAKFMFEGLGINVTEGMKSALDAVRGTAFGLDEAAKAAAQFGASGIKVGTQMTGALRGVAGAAAMTGSSFTEMADIFAGSAGTGKVTNQDLMQFATRGLNAAAAVGKVLGKTEAQVHEMATKGTLDFQTFADAMDKAFGSHATEANKTYEGSLANLHAAMSRLGEAFIGPRLVQKRDVFNALTPVIDNLTAAMKPLFGTIHGITQMLTGSTIENLGKIDFTNLTKAMPSIQQGLLNIFIVFGKIADIAKEAFREIFPKGTESIIIKIAAAFQKLTEFLIFGSETADKLRSIFKGVFSIFSIGWEIIKQTAMFFGELATALFGLSGGKFLDFAARVGDFFTTLQEGLVKGGGIKDFFVELTRVVQIPIKFIQDLAASIHDFFDGLDKNIPDQVGESFGRFGQRIETVKDIADKSVNIWDKFQGALERITPILDTIWGGIKQWFQELGQKIADVMGPGDFDAALDAINLGLLGGIAALLAKFIKDGFTFDIGGGMFEKIGASFEQLTGVLSAMQTKVKAEALMKIAIAIGILTASVLVLSMIDSAALTKALTAMAVGFAQLMGTFAILTKMSSDIKGAASFTIMAAGLIVLSTAILILSGAMKILSTMSWEELAKGLATITLLLGVLVIVSKTMETNSAGMVLAGIGITAMAVALSILAGVMKIFATMDWGEIGKGLITVAGLLVVIGLAMKLMPITLPITAAGLILVGIALNILAGAMKLFAMMDWGEIGKGLVAIAGALVVIGLAMKLMPLTLPITAAGLVLVGIALTEIAGAMLLFSSMDWGEIARGLVAMAGALTILAAATYVMQGTILGAVAIGIVAVALNVLFKAVESFAGLSWGDLLHGLAGLAIALAALGLAAMILSPVIPEMLAMGIALSVIGLGFALFGAGAMLVANALEKVAKFGKTAAQALPEILEGIGNSVGALGRGIAEGVIEMIMIFAEAAPVFAKFIGALLDQILDTLIKLVPKLGEVLVSLIEEIFDIIQAYIPQLIETGILIITSLLQGISDNIGEIVTLVGDIIVNFLDAMTEQIPRVSEALANTIEAYFTGAARLLGEVAATILVGVAVAFIGGFMTGLNDAVGGPDGPLAWFTGLASKVLGWIGDVLSTLWNKGKDILTGFWNGVESVVTTVQNFFTGIASTVLGWVGNVLKTLINKGHDILTGFWDGIKETWSLVSSWFTNLGQKAFDAIGDMTKKLLQIGKDIMQGLWDGLKDTWGEVTGWLGKLNPASWFNDINLEKGHAERNLIPSGMAVMQGLHKGMETEWLNVTEWLNTLDPSESLDKNMARSMANALNDVVSQMESMDDFNPTITPVLDLTQVASEASKISSYINAGTPAYSYAQASTIASDTNLIKAESSIPAGTNDVNFQQIINAPTQLSASDIYKQTRNQITMAKEELSIP